MKHLNVDGYIIDDMDRWLYDLLEIPNLTLAKMRAFLIEAAGDDIELTINCNGGDVFAASAIYDELRRYQGKSTARISGISASASSFMMLGCQKVIASPMATIMMHNSSSYAEGDHRAMEHTAAVLKQIDETIRNAYEAKTGKGRDELKKYMDIESWLTPQDALELGFIDEIDLKDGETLSDPKYSMLLPARMSNSFNPNKLHELAAKLKPESQPVGLSERLTPEDLEKCRIIPPNENGGVSQPVSDKPDPLSAQRKRFLNIRKKLYEKGE